MFDESLVVCSEVKEGPILTNAHFASFSAATSLTKDKLELLGGGGDFFVAYIDVQRLKAIFLELGLCVFFFISLLPWAYDISVICLFPSNV
jgi:hypothetical protein